MVVRTSYKMRPEGHAGHMVMRGLAQVTGGDAGHEQNNDATPVFCVGHHRWRRRSAHNERLFFSHGDEEQRVR